MEFVGRGVGTVLTLSSVQACLLFCDRPFPALEVALCCPLKTLLSLFGPWAAAYAPELGATQEDLCNLPKMKSELLGSCSCESQSK